MILVTGATGLVGAHLLYHLVKNNEKVRAIYRTKDKLETVKNVFSFYTDADTLFAKIEWYKADITEVPAMIVAIKDIKKVYHCAALISFNPKDYREMRKVNIHGTAILVNLCIGAKIDKLCFVSSIAAIGSSLYGEPISEENEWNKDADNSGYSISKFGAEMEVWRASQEGVAVVIVNPGVILGSGFWYSGSGKLFSQMYNGFKFYTEGVTGFVGVQDVVKAMILVMNSEVKNERFILVSENKSFKEIFCLIADAFGKKRPKINTKPWQTAIFWRLSWVLSKCTGKEPLLSKYSAKSTHSVANYSSEKIKETFGFRFEKIEIVIKRVAENFKKTTDF